MALSESLLRKLAAVSATVALVSTGILLWQTFLPKARRPIIIIRGLQALPGADQAQLWILEPSLFAPMCKASSHGSNCEIPTPGYRFIPYRANAAMCPTTNCTALAATFEAANGKTIRLSFEPDLIKVESELTLTVNGGAIVASGAFPVQQIVTKEWPAQKNTGANFVYSWYPKF